MVNDSNYLVQFEAAKSLITLGKLHRQHLWYEFISHMLSMYYCTGKWSKSLVDFITYTMTNGILIPL